MLDKLDNDLHFPDQVEVASQVGLNLLIWALNNLPYENRVKYVDIAIKAIRNMTDGDTTTIQ